MAKKSPVASSTGKTLFPIPRKTVAEDPANLGTADCPWICRCDDSCEYAVKDKSKNPLMPHTEWFCTHLADRLGIASPDCQVIEMKDGTLAFGSRWEGGTLAGTPAGAQPTWVAMVQSGQIPLADIRLALTRVYVFDHFIHNGDRHTKNFLVNKQHNSHAVLAFDYSRAWLCRGFPPPPLPFAPAENTVLAQRVLKQMLGNYIEIPEAKKFLQALRRIPKEQIVRIIDEHPKDWLTSSQRQAIVKWWGSREMLARIDGIEKGVENGTYL